VRMRKERLVMRKMKRMLKMKMVKEVALDRKVAKTRCPMGHMFILERDSNTGWSDKNERTQGCCW
jgi:hypothetical protein